MASERLFSLATNSMPAEVNAPDWSPFSATLVVAHTTRRQSAEKPVPCERCAIRKAGRAPDGLPLSRSDRLLRRPMRASPLIQLLRSQADLLEHMPGRSFAMDRDTILGALTAHEEWERAHPRLDAHLMGPDLSKADAADRLGLSKSTLDTMLKAGQVPDAYRRNGSGSWRIPRASIAAMEEAARAAHGETTPRRRPPRKSEVAVTGSTSERVPESRVSTESASGNGGSSNHASTSVRITTSGEGGSPVPGMTIDVTTSASSGGASAHESKAGPPLTSGGAPASVSPPVSRVTGPAPAPAAKRASASTRPTPMTAPMLRSLDSVDAKEVADDWESLLPPRFAERGARAKKRPTRVERGAQAKKRSART